MNIPDMELVRRYAANADEQAFATLVERHVDFVYAAAVRQVGEAELAKDVTQAVFIVLARKAKRLNARTIMSAWLWRTARFAATDALKAQRRRQQREQEAYMQSLPSTTESDDVWAQMAPVLDASLAKLGEKDRAAVVLRFLEGRSFQDVGAEMGTSEDAAKMRVGRALEKLRKVFAKRGVALPAAVIATAATAHGAKAAPVGVAGACSAAALKGTASSAAGVIAVATTTVMTWAAVKTTLMIGAAAVVVAAGSVVVAKSVQEAADSETWRKMPLAAAVLNAVPPQVTILPTKFPDQGDNAVTNAVVSGDGLGRKGVGLNCSLELILRLALGMAPVRVILPADLPTERLDFMANLPEGSMEELLKKLGDRFGLSIRREMREMDVYVLTSLEPASPGSQSGGASNSGSYKSHDEAVSSMLLKALENLLEDQIKAPIFNESGFSGRLDVTLLKPLQEPQSIENLRRILREKLGLDLVPARRMVEVGVVEKRDRTEGG